MTSAASSQEWEELARCQAEQFTLTTRRYRAALERIREFPNVDPFIATFIDGVLDPGMEHESDNYESLGAFDFTQEDG